VLHFHRNQQSGHLVAQIIMQSPLFVEAMADTTDAISARPSSSPDQYSRVPPPETGLLSTRKYLDGEHYREIAGTLREVARQCRFPGARRELLHMAANYERRGNHIDSRSNSRPAGRRLESTARGGFSAFDY
jgi:hypothetical protein